jgi:hypothetical protein
MPVRVPSEDDDVLLAAMAASTLVYETAWGTRAVLVVDVSAVLNAVICSADTLEVVS